MGARHDDYLRSVPPGSYINVEDFESPAHLAEYLQLLDSNDDLYNQFFRYKDHFRYEEIYDTAVWCRLCSLLHFRDDDGYTHWYDDYEQWWNGACLSKTDGANPWMRWNDKS